ncbi:Putative peroxiredoxin bcp [Anatilimnocola aggregata]|uniref:thioredoxin-dependent peroxiredoxin n=1 Tax=Anatilimnocola aggregata TaxID=2528021 RepID=A0A517Y6C9_9BACT|nr:peroxiredoxin [Anatilimnocola aggregata]QDU25783.1 Putative peroxiredoxin bcp [Anatilimnocola aggregata]
MAAIQVGDRAPEFSGVAQSGELVSLADYLGKQIIVLYFYPRDNTPVCTAQACAFRDAYQDFQQAGAVVIGVSSDSLERHQDFAQGQRLPFLLLSDEDGSLRKAYGVPKTLGLLPGRVTYVIDKQGIVRQVFNSQFFGGKHVTSALAMVKQLVAEG